MAIHDIELEKALLHMMLELEKKIDYVAPTSLRQDLSEQLVRMRMKLINFDQTKWKKTL